RGASTWRNAATPSCRRHTSDTACRLMILSIFLPARRRVSGGPGSSASDKRYAPRGLLLDSRARPGVLAEFGAAGCGSVPPAHVGQTERLPETPACAFSMERPRKPGWDWRCARRSVLHRRVGQKVLVPEL